MTEESVRAVFFKNYSETDDLNEALMLSVHDISMALIKGIIENPESLPIIVDDIMTARSRIGLFKALAKKKSPSVPMIYLDYFDQIRKAVIDATKYARENHGSMDSWFTDRFKIEELKEILSELESAIERSALETPADVRVFNSGEIMLYNEFFSSVLVGILGEEQFKKFSMEFNNCTKTLRLCQSECKALNKPDRTKES